MRFVKLLVTDYFKSCYIVIQLYMAQVFGWIIFSARLKVSYIYTIGLDGYTVQYKPCDLYCGSVNIFWQNFNSSMQLNTLLCTIFTSSRMLNHKKMKDAFLTFLNRDLNLTPFCGSFDAPILPLLTSLNLDSR